MEQNIKTRHFGGQTEFVLDYRTPEKLEASKQNRHFYQRMLRAYLKGKEVFTFGRDPMTNIPNKYKVDVIWK